VSAASSRSLAACSLAAFTLFLYVALLLIAVGAKQNDFYFAATVPNFNL
jgi:hypothetical protein